MSQHNSQMPLFENQADYNNDSPVECLGMTFKNDAARRDHFTKLLREKLQDPEFRQIEGFPIGEDEDILALSDPPYYTACPNPWLADFVKEWEAQKAPEPEGYQYHCEPFAADVSEGKNNPIYIAHSYHTKVPHKAIMRYILHYTKPGDIIFDGFSGTGMTGVAARECGNLSLEQQNLLKNSLPDSVFGERKALLSELSPAATFIAQGYNQPHSIDEFEKQAEAIYETVQSKLGWMYQTKHSDNEFGEINYVIWSDVFRCSQCATELVFWDTAIDKGKGTVLKKFLCPQCNKELTKKDLDRVWVSSSELVPGRIDNLPKKVPIEINYSVGGKTYKKPPDQNDFDLMAEISSYELNHWFPSNAVPNGDKTNEPLSLGITSMDIFFTKRNLICASYIWDLCNDNKLRFMFTSLVMRLTKLSNLHISNYFTGGGGAASGNMKGMLHPPTVSLEQNPLKYWPIRTKAIAKTLHGKKNTVISTGSSTSLATIPSNSVDYIFTDPPFGSNLAYSDLNILWEAWLKVFTNNSVEAIVNRTQKKGVAQYQELISKCLGEFLRILKPGRWITVEFSNTSASVWISLQQALESAGFIVANVAVLDKKQGGYNSNVYAGAVKQDLAISAYKPASFMEEIFSLRQGTDTSVWAFVNSHLKQLPVFVSRDGLVEIIVERQGFQLFDRMVAFHVQRGVSVPMSNTDFFLGLTQRYSERDEMFFLPEQVAEYDKNRLKFGSLKQLSIYVNDEASAIQWLRRLLHEKPMQFSDIHPLFLQELHKLKYEKLPDLRELLQQNFLSYDGNGPVPEQIHAYLSSNWKDMRNLPKNDPTLVTKAKDRWYVPDHNKQADLNKLRERSLLREFETYKESKLRKLKLFRIEAVRTGFKQAWQSAPPDYNTIITIARKLPDDVLQEDQKLLMWYDAALTRTGQSE